MMEVPDFLIEMSKQLNEQGNRMTADPMFEVRCKEYLITEEGYNESHFEIIDDGGNSFYHSNKSDCYDELAQELFDNHKEWCIEFCDDNPSPTFSELVESEFVELFDGCFNSHWYDLPGGFKVIHLQEIEKTINCHFTEKDAQAFIDRKQHDYPKLYIYAISLCYCENMKNLRNWIKDLTTA